MSIAFTAQVFRSREAQPKTNQAAAPNRRPRFPFGALAGAACLVCTRAVSPAAVGEPQRSAAKALAYRTCRVEL